MKKVVIFFVVLSFLSISTDSFADPEVGVGRLADGRAYRTDAEGNQLVDYIAELELSIEGLNRRINSLDLELRDKNSQLNRVQSSSNQTTIKERDLLKVKQAACPPAPAYDCSENVAASTSELNQYIDQLKKDLSQANLQNASLVKEKNKINMCPPADCSLQVASETSELKESIQKLKTEIKLSADKNTKLENILATKAEDFDDQLQTIKADLEQKNQRLSELSKIIDAKNKELETAESKFQVVSARAESAQAQVVRLSNLQMARNDLDQKEQAESSRANIQSASTSSLSRNADIDVFTGRTSLNAARRRAVDSVQSNIRAELFKFNQLLEERQALYKKYKSQNSSQSSSMKGGLLKIGLSPLVSLNGNSLEKIKALVEQANTVGELSQLQRELTQVKAKVNEDITLLGKYSN